MRLIIFRGKHKANNEWAEGNYFYDPDLEYNHIMGFGYYYNEEGIQREFFDVDVIPETVGQYTGVTDKNDKKIFEGDIVKAYKHNEEPFICAITYRSGCFWFGNWNWVEFLDIFRNYEVIGNFFDTPELLKGGVNNG